MNNKTITLTVLGNPKALKRHRTYTHDHQGKPLRFPRKVDASAADKADFLAVVQSQAPERPLKGPLRIDCTWVFPRPKSHYRTGKYAGQLKTNAPTFCGSNPDRDNLDKFVLDTLEGVFFKNDAQAAVGLIKKMYGEKPRAVITIESLNEQ